MERSKETTHAFRLLSAYVQDRCGDNGHIQSRNRVGSILEIHNRQLAVIQFALELCRGIRLYAFPKFSFSRADFLTLYFTYRLSSHQERLWGSAYEVVTQLNRDAAGHACTRSDDTWNFLGRPNANALGMFQHKMSGTSHSPSLQYCTVQPGWIECDDLVSLENGLNTPTAGYGETDNGKFS